MTGVLLAFAASVAWGGSDFVGGLATRRSTPLRATVWTFVGASAFAALTLLLPDAAFSASVLSAGAAAGLACVIGYLAFFGALASGPMGPIAAIVGAVESLVPVAISVAAGSAGLSWLGWLGAALAVSGGVVIGLAERGEGRATPRPLLLAVLGGLGFGFSVVFLDAAPAESGVVAPFVEVAVGLAVLAVFAGVARRWGALAAGMAWLGLVGGPAGAASGTPADGSGPGCAGADRTGTERAAARRAAVVGLWAGVAFALANVLLMAALRIGPLAAVGVAVALYPVTTTVLARVVLHERLNAWHVSGLVAALAGCALLALG